MQARLQAFKKKHQEGVVFIGVAQEKARVPRTVRKAFGNSTIPWIDYSSANVNFYYFYCLDENFGPFFMKFCSYFPYMGSAQIDVKISFKGRQPNKESAAKPLCRYVSPATALHTKRNVITLRIPSMKWSRYSVTNA
jgi:hypothetical protein